VAPIVEVGAAGAGAALLVVAAVWARRLKRQAVRQLRLAMLDPDPATRKAALFVAAERGLGPFADLLVERAHEEADSHVRHALAQAVARSQWEPADSGPLVELRLWAQGLLADAAPATSQAAVAVATAPPTPPPTTPFWGPGAGQEPVIHPQNANGNGNGHNGNGPPPTLVRETRPYPTSRTKVDGVAVETRVRRPGRLTVVVTGAGGPAGVAVIKALSAAGNRVVAADAEPLSAGFRLAPRSGVVPLATDPTFVERLCDLAFDHGARALVPTVAEELTVLAGARLELEDAGVETWIPDPASVEACTDKWKFAQILETAGLPGPATKLGGSTDDVPGPPWIVKPRFGRGSRDVYVVDDADELDWVLARVPDPIVQTRLEGREFTVDALVDRDGRLAGAVPRWRLETKAGISTKGRTFSSPKLTQAVGEVLAAVGLQGPANVQGFVGPDSLPRFVEVNPRFSGGLPLSLAAGADLVGEYVRGIFGEPLRRERLEFRSGVTMTRHFEELFE